MGSYRALLNIPGLRFGKVGIFDDNDPVVAVRVKAGMLKRLDAPALKADRPSLGDADGELTFDLPVAEANEVTQPNAASSKPDEGQRSKPLKSTRKASSNNTLNVDTKPSKD